MEIEKHIYIFPYGETNRFQQIEAHRFSRKYHVHRLQNSTHFSKFIRKDSIVIIDWIHPYCISANIFKTLIKSILFIIQLLSLKLRGCKFIINIHNDSNHRHKHVKIEHLLRQFICHNAMVIRCFSHQSTHLVPSKLQNKIFVRSHPLYPKLVDNQNHKSREYQKFLFVGTERKNKNFPEIKNYFLELTNARDMSPTNLTVVTNERDLEGQKEITYIVNPDHEEFEQLLSAHNAIILAYDKITTSGLFYHAVSMRTLVITKPNSFVKEFLGESYPLYFTDYHSFRKCIELCCSLTLEEYELLLATYYDPIYEADQKEDYYGAL